MASEVVHNKAKVLISAPKAVGIAEPRKWYEWFEKSDTPAERRLLCVFHSPFQISRGEVADDSALFLVRWKLDLIIVAYSVVIYYVKNLDQCAMPSFLVEACLAPADIFLFAQSAPCSQHQQLVCQICFPRPSVLPHPIVIPV
jgi:hypothetical protein